MRAAACIAVAAVMALWSDGAAAGDLGYERVARYSLSTGEGPVLIGDQVLVSRHRRHGAKVRLLGPDGTVRRVYRVQDAGFSSFALDGSGKAIAVITGTAQPSTASRRSRAPVRAAFGPFAGPLRPFPFQPGDVAVAGPRVIATEEGRPDLLHVWDVTSPAVLPRTIAAPGAILFSGAAGHFAGVVAGRFPDLRIVVHDLRDGGEVLRIPASQLQDEAIGPDGRVVLLERAGGGTRIVTATPGDPVRRELATMRLATPRLAVGEPGVAVVRRARRGLGQVVLLGFDGSRRTVTPALNGISELDFDGERLAFTAGRCVFAGPVLADPPGEAPADPCFTAFAAPDFPRLQRFAQTRGARLRVPLTCHVPANNACTAHLRLSGPGFRVHRRTRLAPGDHVVRVSIPAGRRRAAWRRGMSIETIERGRATSGAAIPQ